MAKTPTRGLKVFQAQLGFWDTIVAAPSQPAALDAWGVHQNLFASGQASRVTEEAAIAAATAHPGVPLRRPVGTTDAFSLEPSKSPRAPKGGGAGREAGKAPRERVPKRRSSRAKPDRSYLTSAETALQALETQRRAEEAELLRQQKVLERKVAEARSAYASARKAATADVEAARTSYRKAGGAD